MFCDVNVNHIFDFITINRYLFIYLFKLTFMILRACILINMDFD